MSVEDNVREIQKGILKWYPFRRGSRCLYIGDKNDALFDLLTDRTDEFLLSDLEVVCCAPGELVEYRDYNGERFDYIIAIESLEKLEDVDGAIDILSRVLDAKGHMLLGFNNRLGIRYFFGDVDPHTKNLFDGIEDYRRAYSKPEDNFYGRSYDKITILKLLESHGLAHQNYSAFPDLNNVQILLRDDYETNEDLSIRVTPTYNQAKTVFLEELYMYDALQKNHMLHNMANAFLFDCTFENNNLDIVQVTSSMGRSLENAFFTVIHGEKDENGRAIGRHVEKVPAYKAGCAKLDRMINIAKALKANGVSVVDMQLSNRHIDGTMDEAKTIRMPYIVAPTAQAYFKELAKTNEGLFFEKLDKFISIILKSSPHVGNDNEDNMGVLLEQGYPDLVPLNCFYIDDEFVFFDQEFALDNYPANMMICRTIDDIRFMVVPSGSIASEELFERYNLSDNLDKWREICWDFISKLRKEGDMAQYYSKVRLDANQVYSNRLRMNFSSEEYLRRFVNIFKGIDNKKVIIFGTGRFAKRFMELYGGDYDVEAVIDNNISRQGEDFYDVKISGADVLNSYEHGTYRVIICIKNFLSVTNQLEKMGVSDYVIYDPSQVYERQRKPISVPLNGHNDADGNSAPKKYHTGYIAGVFDLFHVGHLEKFKLAKEQCDYLIVGLVSDEGVVKYKKTTPFIPFEDRKAMLEACRYVDEVVKIPLEFRGTRDAWKMYGFDVQFSGSDYVDDPGWLAEKEFLEQHGVDMVFFPYTESTSSSKLKKLIDEKLI